MAKAFVFSLDAFMALSLILVMLHSLVYLASIPSTYYTNFMQVRYLSQDILYTLFNLNAYEFTHLDSFKNRTLLDYVIYEDDPEVYQEYIGSLIPYQFGYRIIKYVPRLDKYEVLYDSTNNPNDPHAKVYHKLMSTSYLLFYSYKEERRGWKSYYHYMTCSCGKAVCPTECDYPVSLYDPGEVGMNLIGLTIYR